MDLSAGFDTIDLTILLDRLQSAFGVHGTVLDWIKSFASNSKQTVSVDGEKSPVCVGMCGVPQGSVLRPILFLLYCADVV